jgi:diguanylate cyclase (GGDEF)-like protein
METEGTRVGRELREPGASRAALHGLALGGAAILVVATAGRADWDWKTLAVIAVLTIVSDLTSVETGSAKLKVSGCLLGLILAAVLLGGAPAAIIGVLTIAIGWFRWREAPHYLINNLATYAWFPLLAGLFFHAATAVAHVGPQAFGYYLLVFAAFVVALAINFFGIAGYQCHLDGSSPAQKARESIAPVLAAELFSALLTMGAVYVAIQLGTTGLALFALVLVIFQYLVGELLKSKHRSEELHRMATTDELTGLANRERFRNRLEEEIETCTKTGGNFALMLMDLDHFKEINDTLGHDFGDVLLRQLGPRLAACIGDSGIVARLGGDEFAMLAAQHTGQPEELDLLARRVLSCAQDPFVIDELSLEVRGSLGIARFPSDGRDAHTLLRRADLAMYAAKDNQIGYQLYTADQDEHSMQRLSVLSDFRRALNFDEIVVHYQPVVDLVGGRVHGAEGLVRWEHPEFGLLAPGAFIQTVEQTALIGPLTRHVLDRSIEQCAIWRRDGKPLTVAVNLSVRNLVDRSLPTDIERMLFTHALPPDALQLEITESMIMSDPDRALAILTQLSELGVRLSVDDFGTGYSSLANLRRLPIDEIKIDRSFITNMLSDKSDLIIVQSTINLGHDLGLKVIAEGVEDEATLDRLAALGADMAQGFHLSPPVPARTFADWIGGVGTRRPPGVSLGQAARLHAVV